MRHKLLQRQITKFLTPEQIPAMELFLNAVEATYHDLEKSHDLIERSMEISSQELFEANNELLLRSREIETLYKVLTISNDSDSMDLTYEKIKEEIREFTNFPVVRIQIHGDPNSSPDTGDFKGMKTVISHRIFSQEGDELGVLILAHTEPERRTERLLHWLDAVSAQVAMIIERKAMNETLRMQEANMIAASRMSELGKMAGGIAHEINTPLATISLLTGQLIELLEEGEDDKKTQIEMLNVIESTTKHIASIIMGLKTFSRDGKSDPMEPVNLKSLLEKTIIFCKEKLKQHAVDLRLDVPDDVEFLCRGTQLSQVVLNMVTNSYDAIENLKEKWIEINYTEEGDEVVLSIIDSGAGIGEEHRDKLYNPFYTTKPIGKGTGLGLSISLGIINAHGGRIVYNTESAHTRFDIRFPKTILRNKNHAA